MSINSKISISKVYFIEFEILNQSIEYKLSIVSKDKLVLVNRGDFKSLNSKLFKKSLPVVAKIKGKGIVNKIIDKIEATSDEKVLNNLLANASLANFSVFYVESTKNVYASAIRNEKLNEILSVVPKKNIVVEIIIGNGSDIQYGFNNNIDVVSGIRINCLDNKIDSFERELEVESNETITKISDYFFEKTLTYKSSYSNLIDHNVNEQSQKKLFNVLKFGLLILFFSLLIGIDIYASYLGDKMNSLTQKESDKIGLVNFKENLQNKVQSKKSFVDQSGINSKFQLTKFLHELSRTVPQNITLKKIDVRPLGKQISVKRRVQFKNEIIVSGESVNSSEINEWLIELNNIGWIKEVISSNYEFNNRTGLAEFSLKIKFNEVLE